MAAELWVTIAEKRCELIGLDVALEERRVFPGDQIPDMEPFRVLGRRCTADIACNLAGVSCKWA
jgi:hypothetical protein